MDFWCWKTESTLDWDMKRLNEFKMLPDPLFQYNSMNGNGVEENDGFGLLNIDFQETIPKNLVNKDLQNKNLTIIVILQLL